MNLLFICARNRLRSPTAEQVFATYPGVHSASAGVNRDADVPVDGELLQWADLVLVMEPVHKRKLVARFARFLASKRVVCLNIPDDYGFMDPHLIELLKRNVAPYLPGR